MPSRRPPIVEWREFCAAFLPSIRLFPEWADELPPALQLLPSCRTAQSRHPGRREPGFAPCYSPEDSAVLWADYRHFRAERANEFPAADSRFVLRAADLIMA